MNLQQLETFHWVVTLESFTKAAVKLNTSQSTVSMRIASSSRNWGSGSWIGPSGSSA